MTRIQKLRWSFSILKEKEVRKKVKCTCILIDYGQRTQLKTVIDRVVAMRHQLDATRYTHFHPYEDLMYWCSTLDFS